MGKSRLVAEFVRLAEQRGVVVALGECQSYGTNTGYFVVARGLVDAVPSRRQPAGRRAGAGARDRARGDRRRRSCRARRCSAALLDLPIPDNDLTAQFDAKLRKTSLEGLLVAMPAGTGGRGAARARARGLPLARSAVPRSRSRCSAARWRACVCCWCSRTGRARDAGSRLGDRELPHFSEIVLAELDDHAVGAAHPVEARADRSGAGEPPAALVELVTTQAQGNPFYIEELLNFIRGQGVDLQNESALKQLQLPESLHSLILSRIDTLDESPRRTLKVASVLGRVFRAPMLPGGLPGARRARRGGGAPAGARREPTSSTSTRRPSRRISSSTSSRRKSPTRACRSRSARCCTSAVGGYIETMRGRCDRAQPRPARAPLLAQREPAEEARVPRARRRCRPGLLRERGGDRLLRASGAAGRARRAGRRAAQARQGARARRRVAPRRAGRGRGARRWRRASTTSCALRVVRDRARGGRAQAGPLRRGGRAARSRGARIRRPRRRGGRRAGCCTSPGPWRRSAATTRRRSRITRRASRFASGWATRRAWAACCRISASSPSIAATTTRSRALPRARARAAHGDRRPLGDRQCRRTTSG